MCQNPTSDPEINELLRSLEQGARAILGNHFVGMYLDGSLAYGGFDADSDIDFVIVTEDEIGPETFAALQDMHAALARLDTPWAIQLEGSYISRHAVRRYDPAYTLYPNIEFGQGERLKLAEHNEMWAFHRAILRGSGIVLAGPPPADLIDPVAPEEIRRAAWAVLHQWTASLEHEPQQVNSRDNQSYVVLTVCRVLYTLATGTIASKRAAVDWAVETLGERWHGLIERAWEGRHHPGTPIPEGDMEGMSAFVRFALDKSGNE